MRDFFSCPPFPFSPLPPASPSCPFPPSLLPYWEVFHEQLGPRRGEVSERGALCIIQWLSGVCMCVFIHVLCVWPPTPPLSIGRCQVTGRPWWWLSAGSLLEQSHCSQHYHKLMRKPRDVTQESRTMSTPKRRNLNNRHFFYFAVCFHFLQTVNMN